MVRAVWAGVEETLARTRLVERAMPQAHLPDQHGADMEASGLFSYASGTRT